MQKMMLLYGVFVYFRGGRNEILLFLELVGNASHFGIEKSG
jgi:hypothetical protein